MSGNETALANVAQQMAITSPVFRLYPCAPSAVLKRLSGRSVTSERCPVFTLPKRFRRFVKTPERIDALEFAERHRIVPDSAAHSGKWRREHAPHTAKILKTFSDSRLRELWYCASEQSGKTMTLTNCLAWSAEQLAGDIFYLMPGEEAAKNIVEQLLKPLFTKSDHLREYLSDRKDDTANTRIRLRNGKIIRPSWATSALSMATWPAQCIFGDEVDKYVLQSGSSAVDKDSSAQKKEADPITLIRKRARTFRGREKLFFCSTPAGRYIRKGTEACHQVWEWRLRCPHCHELIRPEGEHLILSENDTVEHVEQNGCTMACHSCGGEIDEQRRIEAIRGGTWVPIKGADIARPEKVGFIHRAWDCLDVTLKEIGIAWLKNKAGKITDKIAWANGIEADDYQHKQQDRKEDAILALCDMRPAGEVHQDTDALIISIDTQDKGFWFTIRGWQYGAQMTSWLVRAGYVPSARFDDFSGLDKIIFEDTYRDCNGLQYPVKYGIIDSQGHRTTEVYSWCKRTGIFASQGAQGRRKQPVTYSEIEYYPGTKKAIPGGLRLYSIDTHHHKDIIADKLQVDIGDPGAFVLYSGYTNIQVALKKKHPDLPMQNGLTDYARHFCAEILNERRMWENPHRRPEHLWDCEQMGVALAYYLRFDALQSESGISPPPQQRQHAEKQPTGRITSNLPSWFNRR